MQKYKESNQILCQKENNGIWEGAAVKVLFSLYKDCNTMKTNTSSVHVRFNDKAVLILLTIKTAVINMFKNC
jgi:hypothetical protein